MAHPSQGGVELRGSEERQISIQESEGIFLSRELRNPKSEPSMEAASQRGEHLETQTIPQG